MKQIKTISAGIFLLANVFAFSVPANAQTTKLTDPEIASVAVVANQGDIEFAAIAEKRSKNADVIKFAKTMSKDHQAVIDKAVALVTKLKVTPKDNALSEQLTANAAKTKAMLNKESSANFDKAYIDNEVAYHKSVIDAIESTLIPDAANAELKDLLTSVLPLFKEHLAHAEMVQKEFSK